MVMGSFLRFTLVAACLLLIGGVLSLLFTINGFRPSRNAGTLVLSFAASMITLELAGHHLAWQAIVSGVLVWLGALDHAVGKVGLCITLVSWAGLLLMLVQGSRTRGIMHNTLQAYVQDWSGPRVPSMQLLAPFPFRRGGIVIERDVVYRHVAGRRLKLDVYRPATETASRPAIVQIHGGAWMVGDKRDQGVPLCAHLARNGWVAFNVNYRLSPGATFPDHLVDLKYAIAWIRSHALQYGVDPSFIAVTGGSAGGHLAALVALTLELAPVVRVRQRGVDPLQMHEIGAEARVRAIGEPDLPNLLVYGAYYNDTSLERDHRVLAGGAGRLYFGRLFVSGDLRPSAGLGGDRDDAFELWLGAGAGFMFLPDRELTAGIETLAIVPITGERLSDPTFGAAATSTTYYYGPSLSFRRGPFWTAASAVSGYLLSDGASDLLVRWMVGVGH